MTNPEDEFMRVPPHDAEAERAVLGGMMLYRDSIPDVVEILEGTEFYKPANETVYRAIVQLAAAGEPVDPITLANALRTSGDLTRVGGAPALHNLANTSFSVANAHGYAEIVREMAVRRRLAQVAEQAAHLARSGDGDLDGILAQVSSDLTAIGTESVRCSSATGWDFTDLGPVLDGTYKPVTACVGARDDGIGLFYPGRVNGVQGESEAGKSWLALIAALAEINRGNHVVYIDFEDSEEGVVGRLLLIGAVPEDLRERFHYVRPGAIPSPAALAAFVKRVGELEPTLIVVDGVTEAMSLLGLELKDNTEIAKFGRMLLRPLANTGAAVVPLDHVVKNNESRGRYALGGVHKLNAVDGVQYMLEAVRPFGINTEGRSRLRIAKDRPAQVRKHALPGGKNPMHWFADLVVKSEGDQFAEAHIYPPMQRADDPTEMTAEEEKAAKEEAEIKERESKVITVLRSSETKLSMTELVAVVPGRASVTRRAVTRLVANCQVITQTGPRNAVLHGLPAPEVATA
ncbi:DnaB-like helicase N-terminal domain-containing protein [Streptomyces sp. NPDC002730]|uniref:DnaB-like helicase N-terminal domain-containing protein n=1 Tax=Streptomyces sp. NPDC002730 TaxID=3364662 RepID=UPI0036802D48